MDPKNPTLIPLKPIEIFRPGAFIASNGQQYSFTAAQVQELATTYKPEFSDAPLVVGHPKMDSPRWGHAGRLFVNAAGVLCAEPADVVPEFAEAIKAKHYPKVSASIYLPNAPGNPTPGKHYLRHIGFLGGVAPAVKGLRSVEFSEAEVGVVDFGYEERVIVQLFRGLRDWIISTAGLEKADEVLPSYSLDVISESAIREEVSAYPIPGFSTPNPKMPTEANLKTEDQLKAQEAALAERQAALDARDAAISKQEAAARLTSNAEFCEVLVTGGQLLPAQKAGVVEILNQLAGANQVADFAAGDENHGKTGADLFKQFLTAQPKLVEFGRISPAAHHQAAGVADFAAPMGETVDAAGLETVNKANAYMAAHPGVSFINAVMAVQAA